MVDSTAELALPLTGTQERKPQSRSRYGIFLEPAFLIPAIIMLVMIICAIFAPRLAPYDPLSQSLTDRLQPPGYTGAEGYHLLGTDKLGRDVLSRVIWGARISLGISVVVVLITAGVGTAMAIIAGYMGGWVDGFLMRVTDIGIAFPGILILLLMAVIMGPSFKTVVVGIAILGWAPYARLLRGEVLQLRQTDFVNQARIIGCSPLRIMVTHILPNIVNTLLVLATLFVGLVILLEAAASFLGAGIPPPTAAWGSMISDGRDLISSAWWISFFPGIAIGLTVLSCNFLGDWLRDKLDPRLRQI